MTDNTTIRPQFADQIKDAVAWAVDTATPLEVVAGGSKRAFGRPVTAARTLDTAALTGISLYQPEELVLTAGPATPMADIESTLANQRQQLAFEPPDFGPLLGQPAGVGTLVGTIACNLAGSRRLKAGAARDHVLGLHAVSGRGEIFKTGGRVVKNVTGYDLCKLLTGSFGTLAVITELTVKVLPAPEKTRTVLVYELDDATATAAMTAALNGSHEVSGAAHLPAELAKRSDVDYVGKADKAVTALRVEGVGPSVTARCAALRQALSGFGSTEELHSQRSVKLWRELRDVLVFHPHTDQVLWRLSTAPQAGHTVAAAILQQLGGQAYFDWGGGLVWLALPTGTVEAGHAQVRAALATAGGHATLVRAPESMRAAIPVFEPLPPPVMKLTQRLREAFDPKGILNPGRMYAET